MESVWSKPRKVNFLKRRARGLTLEASVLALKTKIYARSRLRARGSDLCTLSPPCARLNFSCGVREARLSHALAYSVLFWTS